MSQSVLGAGLLFATACAGSVNSADSSGATETSAIVWSVPITTVLTTAPTTPPPATIVPTKPVTSVATPTTLAVGLRAEELFVAWESGVLSLHDPNTGEFVRVITTIYPGEQLVYDPVRSTDGTTYMSTGIDDSWYSCDTADGYVMALTAKGDVVSIGAGGAPHISADGSQLAYVRSSECRPDPNDPNISVLVVTDTIVVRNVASGAEHSWTFPGAFDGASVSPVVESIAWYGDRLLCLVDGRLVMLDPSDPTVPSSAAGTAVELTIGDPNEMVLLGARADGMVLAQVFPSAEMGMNSRLIALDPTTGRQVAELAVLAPTSAAVDQSGTRWAALRDNALIVDGVETVLEPPPLPVGLDSSFGDRPRAVGW